MPSSFQSVPTVTVFDYEYQPGSATLANPVPQVGVTIRISLDYSQVNTTSPQVNLEPVEIRVLTDGNGYWQVNLVPNSAINPLGTLWQVSTPSQTYTISVPSSGPVQSSTIKVGAPVTLTPQSSTSGPLTVAGNLTVTGNETVAGLTIGSPAYFDLLNGKPVYDAKAFGARGDGTTDDTAAVQAAVAACKAGGGGVVFFPPGTYILNPNIAGVTNGIAGNVAIVAPSNTIVRGAGRGATVLRMKAGASVGGGSAAQLVTNDNLASDITVEDLTIDGNGANQTVATNGIVWWRATRVKISRVRFINVFTTSTSEEAGMQTISSSFVAVRDCDFFQNGFAAGGLAFSGCIQCEAIACSVTGVAPISGTSFRPFVCDGSQLISWIDCHSYLNTTTAAGFDCNTSSQIRYIGCISGGTGAAQFQSFPAPEPYEVFSKNLGNTGPGFNLNVCVACDLVNCMAVLNGSRGVIIQGNSNNVRIIGGQYNGNLGANGQGILLNGSGVTNCELNGVSCFGNAQTGISIVSASGINVIGCQALNSAATHGLLNNGGTKIKIVGGAYQSNTSNGIAAFAAADVPNMRVTGGPAFGGNTGADWGVAGTNFSAFGNVAAPAVPASGTALTSPFIFDADVYVAGGTVTAIAIGGVATGLTATPAMIRVPAGQTITLTYSAAPTWTWFLA